MNPPLNIFRKFRLNLSRLLMLGVFVLDMFSITSLHTQTAATVVLESIALVLVLIATFGRVWALSYISGNKTHNLINTGPYSLMRNPLYFFSFCGAAGLGIASKSMLIAALVILPFAIYYPLVIRSEEKHLEGFHGEKFRQFKATVPAFFPSFSNYHEPETYQVNARLMRRSFFSVMWFPIVFFYMITLDRLQASHILHTVFLIK